MNDYKLKLMDIIFSIPREQRTLAQKKRLKELHKEWEEEQENIQYNSWVNSQKALI